MAESQIKRDSSSRENLLWEKGTGKLVNRSERKIELCGAVGFARREQGDEVVLLDFIFGQIHTKALVDTEASGCFMSVEFRASLPDGWVQDKWEVDRGKISLADNSSQTILEQIRA